MSPEASRRKKAPRQYRVLIVPSEEGGRTRSITLSRIWMVLAGLGILASIVMLTLATVMYTPLGRYVPIPNPELERRYGAQLRDTQERLASLTEDVLLLRDYNVQLRKILGEGPSDSAHRARLSPSVMLSGRELPAADSTPRQAVQDESTVVAEPVTASSYTMTGSAEEEFRAAFPLVAPAEGLITQEFDPGEGHFGIDYAAREGSPVMCAADGYVIFAGWTYDSGNMMMVAHGGGYVTVYRHARSLFRGEHAFVRRGELVALIGNTGRTSGGPHLHFELWKDGLALDPREYLLTSPTVQ
jgi:murein DD-endopeptidase MepM/ murein hydrolase activator NlpD